MRYLFLLLMLSVTLPVYAQADLGASRESLRDLDGFVLNIQAERSGTLQEIEALNIARLRKVLLDQIQAAGLPLRITSVDEHIPALYVHVNALDASRGLVPFTIEVGFYQQVQLQRIPQSTLFARTWETAIVGLASHNTLHIITEAAEGLVDEFIEDFQRMNR